MRVGYYVPKSVHDNSIWDEDGKCGKHKRIGWEPMFTASDVTQYTAQGKPQAIIEPVNPAEIMRLTLLHKLLTHSVGGIRKAYPELAQINRVLDVGYGAGAWALDVAFVFPELEVIGGQFPEQEVSYTQAQTCERLRGENK